MTSVDFNFAEPIASFDDSMEMGKSDAVPADVGSIHKSNFVVIKERPVKVVEVKHAKPGKHGHSKVHLVGIDIFTSQRYEIAFPSSHVIQVPKITKKDYLLIDIADDGFISLMDEETCAVRRDLRVNYDSDEVHQRLIDQFNQGDGQIKVTVLKALGEEKIISFKKN